MEVGYFCDKNREYIIENMRPVRPLKNYLWNDTTFAEYANVENNITFTE